jgi:hypothetical protein
MKAPHVLLSLPLLASCRTRIKRAFPDIRIVGAPEDATEKPADVRLAIQAWRYFGSPEWESFRRAARAGALLEMTLSLRAR